jgi:hypothetical protein
MSISLRLNNSSVATIKQTINPPQGVIHWLVQTCNTTKNWNDIAKLGRDFFEWVGESAKYQGNTSLAEWTVTPSKIFGQATKGTLIPFVLGATVYLATLSRADGLIGGARKIILFVMSGTLFGAITLGIGALSQPLSIVVFTWYTFDLGVQMRNLMIVRELQANVATIQPAPVAPTWVLQPQPLQQLIAQQNKLAMIQVAKSIASWASAVFSELCPAYAVTSATLSVGSSLLGAYLLHARETGPYQFKIL